MIKRYKTLSDPNQGLIYAFPEKCEKSFVDLLKLKIDVDGTPMPLNNVFEKIYENADEIDDLKERINIVNRSTAKQISLMADAIERLSKENESLKLQLEIINERTKPKGDA